MREVLDLLEAAAVRLRKVKDHEPIDRYSEAVQSEIYLAYNSIDLAKLRLHLFMDEEEEPCEKS